MFCSKCGNQLKDGERFCSRCGQPVQPGAKAQNAAPMSANTPQPGAKAPGATQSPGQPGPGQAPGQPGPGQAPGQPRPGQAPSSLAQQYPNRSKQAQPHPGASRGSAGLAPAYGTASLAPKKKSRIGAVIGIVAAIVIVGVIAFAATSFIKGVAERIEYLLDPQAEQESGWLQNDTGQSGGGTGQSGGSTGTGTTPGTGTDPTQGPAQPVTSDGAGDTWTVLVYLCGSDLESQAGYATYDLVEIQEADISDKVNMVLEAGGTARWQNSVFEAGYLNRCVCRDGSYDIVEQPRMASMGSQSTFEDFVAWGTKNYPADHYMLLFWDHGGGTMYGVCNDEMYGTDMLTVAEMRDGLKNSGVHFDVVGFDTCLMGTYETAAALAPYADYMIASEEIISGAGWNYTPWVTWLSSNTGCTGEQLGKQICDTYMSACEWYGMEDTATLSCIDLSAIPALTKAFEESAAELALATTDKRSLQVLAQAANGAEYYGEVGYNMIDMYDFVQDTGSIQSAAHLEALLGAIDEAVVYEVHGRNRAGAHGLSVFYPLYVTDEEFDEFAKVAPSTSYLQATAVIAGTYDNYQWSQTTPLEEEEAAPVTENEVSISWEQHITDDGYLRMTITDGLENVANVKFELALLLGSYDNFRVIYLGSDNNIYADWDNGIFTDNFNGTWMTIDGCYVCAELMDSRDGYNLYLIPVRLNGTDMFLRASYDFEKDKYTVLDACDTIDEQTGAASKARPLQNGDKVTFLFADSTTQEGASQFIEMGTVTWHDGIEMKDEDLGDGNFAYCFRIEDVFGKTQSTENVVVDYSNGKIVLKSIEDWVSEQM